MLVWTILGIYLLIYFSEPTQLLQFYPQKTEHHVLPHLLAADKYLPRRVVSGSVWKAFHKQVLSNSLLHYFFRLPKIIGSFHDIQHKWTFMVVQNSYSPLSRCSQHACFLTDLSHTKQCFVSHFFTFSIQSLSGQFLPWIAMFSESCCPTTLYPPQCFVECTINLSCLKPLFLIKSLCCT